MKIINLTLSTLLLLTLAIQVNAASLEMIELKHRPAENMIPILKPLLDKDGVISGTGFNLIIRTSEPNLQQLKEVIQKLDTAPRQLLIYVKQLSEDEYRKQHSNAKIHATDKKVNANIRIYSTHDRDEGNVIQKVRVLEGNPAFIEAGQAIPLGERVTNGHSVQETVRYKNVTRGFYVLPRVSGNKVSGERVTLFISPHKASLSPEGGGKINIQQVETTVSGKLGEWMEIGGSTSYEQHKGTGFTYRTKSRSSQSGRTMIKVEEIK